MPKDRSFLPWYTIRPLNLGSLDDVCVPLSEAKRLPSLLMLLMQVTIPLSLTHDPSETCLSGCVGDRVYTTTAFSTHPFTQTLQSDPISRHIAFITVIVTARRTNTNNKKFEAISRSAQTKSQDVFGVSAFLANGSNSPSTAFRASLAPTRSSSPSMVVGGIMCLGVG